MTDISIKNIHNFLSGEGKTLTGEEEKFLNTIFKDVDKEDKEGKTKLDGDGFLNNNEWTSFKNILKTYANDVYNKLIGYINHTNDNIDYDYSVAPIKFDIDMYSDKALRKAFPEDKYEILDSLENDGLGVTIIDKKTKKEVLKITNIMSLKIEINNKEFAYNNDNTLFYQEDKSKKTRNWYEYDGSRLIEKSDENTTYRYGANGEYSVSDNRTGERIYYDKNNKEIYKDIDVEAFRCALGQCFARDGACTDEQGFRNLMAKINETNVLDILGYPRCHNNIYNFLSYLHNDELNPNINKSTLITMSELYKKAINQAEQKGIYTGDIDFTRNFEDYYINKLNIRCNSEQGELKDEPITKNTKIEQGETGNCWLLDKIINLAQTEDGQELLNNMYTVQKDMSGNIKTITVTVQGKQHIIPIEEIKGANELSSGNLYVRAIEIGVFRYLQELGLEHTYGFLNDEPSALLGINGGNSSMGAEILIGNGVELRDDTGSLRKVVDKTKYVDDNFINEIKSVQNAIIGVSTTKEGFKGYVVETGELENIVSHHAYSVIGKDDEYIYLVEPSNNKKTLRMTYEEFKNCFEKGDITPIKQPQEDNEKVLTQTGKIYIPFTDEDYEELLLGTLEPITERVKKELQENFDFSKYDIEVNPIGNFYYEYNIMPKQR